MLQLERRLVEDVVSDVFFVGQNLMDSRPGPRPVEIGAVKGYKFTAENVALLLNAAMKDVSLDT